MDKLPWPLGASKAAGAATKDESKVQYCRRKTRINVVNHHIDTLGTRRNSGGGLSHRDLLNAVLLGLVRWMLRKLVVEASSFADRTWGRGESY